MQDPVSSTGPEVLPGSNQGPNGFSIPTFYFLQKVIPQDIRPATLSSWLKQLICYKQAEQPSLDLVQVKAHDIRAVVASKAFFGGVFRWTKSCKLVTGKLTIHVPILSLQPYFARF